MGQKQQNSRFGEFSVGQKSGARLFLRKQTKQILEYDEQNILLSNRVRRRVKKEVFGGQRRCVVGRGVQVQDKG